MQVVERRREQAAEERCWQDAGRTPAFLGSRCPAYGVVIPACLQAGMDGLNHWIPACAGMTNGRAASGTSGRGIQWFSSTPAQARITARGGRNQKNNLTKRIKMVYKVIFNNKSEEKTMNYLADYLPIIRYSALRSPLSR